MQCKIADANGNDIFIPGINSHACEVCERALCWSYLLLPGAGILGEYLCSLLFHASQIFLKSFFKDSVSLYVALLVVWASVQSVESHQLIICG
jgi:hypothetical protein